MPEAAAGGGVRVMNHEGEALRSIGSPAPMELGRDDLALAAEAVEYLVVGLGLALADVRAHQGQYRCLRLFGRGSCSFGGWRVGGPGYGRARYQRRRHCSCYARDSHQARNWGALGLPVGSIACHSRPPVVIQLPSSTGRTRRGSTGMIYLQRQ